MYLQTFVFLFFFGERKNYKHYSTTCFQIFLPICCTTLSFSPLQRDYRYSKSIMSSYGGCHMYNEEDDTIVRPATDVFEINDFTAATEWENFIDDIENVLR